MRILVTGATGLVGSSFVAQARRDTQIFVLGKHKQDKQTAEGVTWIGFDLGGDLDATALPNNIDCVVHLAQSRHFKSGLEAADDIFAINTRATARLLDWAHSAGVRKFIYFSSGSVYKPSPNLLSTNSPIKTAFEANFYEASKISSEYLVASYRDTLDARIIRPFYVYGPQQGPQMLIPRLFNMIRDNLPIQIQGRHGAKINPIHVEDAVQILLNMVQGNEPLPKLLNICGPDVLTISELAVLIAERLHRQPILKTSSAPANDTFASNLEAEKFLGHTMKGMAEGLDTMIQT